MFTDVLCQEKPTVDNNCQAEGIFSPVAGIMGTLQANEVLKTILGERNDLSSRLLIFNALKLNSEKPNYLLILNV